MNNIVTGVRFGDLAQAKRLKETALDSQLDQVRTVTGGAVNYFATHLTQDGRTRMRIVDEDLQQRLGAETIDVEVALEPDQQAVGVAMLINGVSGYFTANSEVTAAVLGHLETADERQQLFESRLEQLRDAVSALHHVKPKAGRRMSIFPHWDDPTVRVSEANRVAAFV